jgi:hypothetical protein
MNSCRLSKPIRRRATAALVAITSLSLVVGAAPATADSSAWAVEHLGAAAFKRAGNTMDVCDTAYDGASVAVQRRGDRRIVAVNYWGSLKYNGCRRWHIRGRNGTAFSYRVCPAYHARPGGKRITLSTHFCSGWQPDRY